MRALGRMIEADLDGEVGVRRGSRDQIRSQDHVVTVSQSRIKRAPQRLQYSQQEFRRRSTDRADDEDGRIGRERGHLRDPDVALAILGGDEEALGGGVVQLRAQAVDEEVNIAVRTL